MVVELSDDLRAAATVLGRLGVARLRLLLKVLEVLLLAVLRVQVGVQIGVILDERKVLVLGIALALLRLLRVQQNHLLLIVLHFGVFLVLVVFLGSRFGKELRFLSRRLEIL